MHGDLKPENILIDSTGHLKLTDFGLSKGGQNQSQRKWLANYLLSDGDDSPSSKNQLGSNQKTKKAFIGTPYYVAPETIDGQDITPSADWWALGVIMFEILLGEPPFIGDTPDEVFKNILSNTKVKEIPIGYNDDQISPEAASLINGLLTKEQINRIGYNGAVELKNHPFFQSVNWDTLRSQEPPFVPKPIDITDTSYFQPEKGFTSVDLTSSNTPKNRNVNFS